MKLPKNWKKILSMALFIMLVGLLGWYLYRHWDEMRELLALDGRTVTLMLLFALCGCVMNCVYHRILLSVYGVPLDVVDWMGVVFVANAIAYVLPMRADLIFSATYYKRAKGLAYVKSVSMAAGNVVFGVMFALLQMLAALLCAGLLNGQWPLLLWAVLAAGILCVAVFLVGVAFLEGHLAVMDRYDPEHRVGLIVDEWGTWFEVEPGTNPGFLYQQNTLRDAQVAALTLDIFIRHCDRLSMANLAQTVNVLQAMLLTEGDRTVKTPTYHVFDLYKAHQDAAQADVDVQCAQIGENGVTLPQLSASASVKDGLLTITCSNASPTDEMELDILLKDFDATGVRGRMTLAAS